MSTALTPREIEVVRLISLGCSVREVAKVLRRSPSTIDNHKHRAMQKLGVDKVALLTRHAIKMRISYLNERLTLSEKRRSGRKGDGWN